MTHKHWGQKQSQVMILCGSVRMSHSFYILHDRDQLRIVSIKKIDKSNHIIYKQLFCEQMSFLGNLITFSVNIMW